MTDNTLNSGAGASGSSPTPTRTRLNFSYERPIKAHAIRDWITAHPRIALPIAAFLLGSITYTVFDPIRAFCIQGKVLGWFDYRQWAVTIFVKKNILAPLGLSTVPPVVPPHSQVTLSNQPQTKEVPETSGGGFTGFIRKNVLEPIGVSSATTTPEESHEHPPDSVKASDEKTKLPSGPVANNKRGLSTSTDRAEDQVQGEWQDRLFASQALFNYLAEVPNTIALLHGPQGSGKSRLMARVLLEESDRRVLTIDCEAISKGGDSDSALLLSLAKQTGYWPIFSFLSSLNNLMDLAAMGLIGQKAGFSTSVETQMKEILGVSESALKEVTARLVKKKEKAAKKGKTDVSSTPEVIPIPRKESEQSEDPTAGEPATLVGTVQGEIESSIDTILAKTGIKTKTNSPEVVEKKSSHPVEFAVRKKRDESVDTLPIVILRNFHAKSTSPRQEALLTALADWAASLVQNKVAHVIVLTDNRDNMRRLTKALPSRPLASIALSDADPPSALSFVTAQLKASGMDVSAQLSQDEINWINRLGGRASDLYTLVHKVRNGSSIQESVEDIIARDIGELRKNAFGDDEDDAKALGWSREQAWSVFKQLAKVEELSYAQVLLDFPFKGDESALRTMEHAELISITTHDGLPMSIRPGKPVYKFVFQRLVDDTIFRAVQDISYNQKAISTEEKTIKTCEDELQLLKSIGLDTGSSMFGGNSAAAKRAYYLLDKMKASQEKLEKLETDVKNLKKLLGKSVSNQR